MLLDKTTPMFVFYHAGCSDGRMAAAVVNSLVGPDVGIPLCAINYNSHDVEPDNYFLYLLDLVRKEKLTEKTRQHAFVFVDFCPRPNQVKALIEEGICVTIIDHHKSAYDAMEESGFCTKPLTLGTEQFDDWRVYVDDRTDKEKKGDLLYLYSVLDSGALMTYKFFALDKYRTVEQLLDSVPDFIKWVSDRDTWAFKYPESKPFSAGMSRYRNVKPGLLMDLLTEETVAEVLATGKLLMEADESYVRRTMAHKFAIVKVERRSASGDSIFTEVAFLNNNYLPSEVGNGYIVSQSTVDIVVQYTVIDETEVRYTVRSRKDCNSLWLSGHFGGGGHPNANGFNTDLQTFVNILTDRTFLIEN